MNAANITGAVKNAGKPFTFVISQCIGRTKVAAGCVFRAMNKMITRCYDTTCLQRRKCLRFLRRASGAVCVRTLWMEPGPCLLYLPEAEYAVGSESGSDRARESRLSSPPIA